MRNNLERKSCEHEIGASNIRAGDEVTVKTYLPSKTCVARYGDISAGEIGLAVWLLRNERGELRTLTDNRSTIRPIGSFSTQLADEIQDWTDPRLAMTYVFLKPGLVIPEGITGSSPVPAELIAIAGWADFLKVYRAIYLNVH